MRTGTIPSPTESRSGRRYAATAVARPDERVSRSSDVATAHPLVSVIMPVWNAERFLAEAIESVRAQTYAEWELLLVDDGSTDASAAICWRYAALDPARIRYFQHPERENRGRCPSRNLGLRHARGELLAFLDADDVYLPQKLERQVAILERERDAAMVYGRTLQWHGWTGRPDDARHDRRQWLGVNPGALVPAGVLPPIWLRRRGQTPGMCGVLVRRSVVQAIGGFDESLRDLFEDQAFHHKIALRHPVFVDEATYDLYRRHPDSTCSVDKANRRRAGRNVPNPHYLAFLAWLERYLRSEGVGDRAVWRAMRVERFLQRHRRIARLARETRRRLRTVLRTLRGAIAGGSRD